MRKIFVVIILLNSISAFTQTVRIAAASDLRYAFEELILSFEQRNNAINIDVVYGSSGQFYTQITNGAPFDIYFSADKLYPQKLYESGLIVSKPESYGVGRLVLWSSSLDVTEGLSVLSGKKLRIATANPAHAPYGIRAIEALKYYNVYNESMMIYGENISQAAQFCSTGNADAGILALSLALSPNLKSLGSYFLIDDKAHQPLEQAFVVLKSSKEMESVTQFVTFIKSKEARVIFEKYGFALPKDKLN